MEHRVLVSRPQYPVNSNNNNTTTTDGGAISIAAIICLVVSVWLNLVCSGSRKRARVVALKVLQEVSFISITTHPSIDLRVIFDEKCKNQWPVKLYYNLTSCKGIIQIGNNWDVKEEKEENQKWYNNNNKSAVIYILSVFCATNFLSHSTITKASEHSEPRENKVAASESEDIYCPLWQQPWTPVKGQLSTISWSWGPTKERRES